MALSSNTILKADDQRIERMYDYPGDNKLTTGTTFTNIPGPVKSYPVAGHLYRNVTDVLLCEVLAEPATVGYGDRAMTGQSGDWLLVHPATKELSILSGAWFKDTKLGIKNYGFHLASADGSELSLDYYQPQVYINDVPAFPADPKRVRFGNDQPIDPAFVRCFDAHHVLSMPWLRQGLREAAVKPSLEESRTVYQRGTAADEPSGRLARARRVLEAWKARVQKIGR